MVFSIAGAARSASSAAADSQKVRSIVISPA
jgi:hypothetical protein